MRIAFAESFTIHASGNTQDTLMSTGLAFVGGIPAPDIAAEPIMGATSGLKATSE
ncbi:MAG: hypothetical protein M3Y08_16515 [Fibrobacterota bacterium]|nr:hypothetical protein [Fibrobacterota bacterium]